MADSKSFLESIEAETDFDDWFFKRVYGYSLYVDTDFIQKVNDELNRVNRKDVVADYNDWLKKYKDEKDKQDKEAGEWLHKRINDWYNRQLRETQGYSRQAIETQEITEVDEWEQIQEQKALLLKKKLLLLKGK